MPKILHVTNAFPYREVPEYGIFVKEQVDSLNRAGVLSDVLFINGKDNGKKAYLMAIGDIRRRAKDYDVIHAHHLYSGLASILAMTGKPLAISFLNDWLHELDEVTSVAIRKLMCNFGAWRADRVIFKSPIPPQFVGDKKFVYLPNGANSTQFHITSKIEARQALGLHPSRIYALFVSSKDRDRPQKRYDRFVATLEQLRRQDSDLDIAELVLVNQPRDRVLNYFNAADLHLMTSDYEGSPNSVKEALCCGLAVVAPNVGNVADLMSGVPGCHVATGFEPAELAELVQQTLATELSREDIRNAFLTKDFSQEGAVRNLLQMYNSMIAKI